MGSISDIVNALLPFKEKIAVQIVMGWIDINAPVLNLPVINQIVEFLVQQFIDLIVTKLGIFTVNIATVIQTGMNETAFRTAAERNYEAQINGTIADKQKALNELLDAARLFIVIRTP